MDAAKFLEEAGRMCKSFKYCVSCPLRIEVDDISTIDCLLEAVHLTDEKRVRDCVKIVEEWIEKNPKKTRLSEFKKLFPNNTIEYENYPALCVKRFDNSRMCEGYVETSCAECKRIFWDEEIE